MLRNYILVMATLFALVFSGCSGGGDNGNSGSSSDTTAPVFISSNSASVNENQTSAITLSATDTNSVTYSISGGDSASFNVNSSTGAVTFKLVPDYETKAKYTFTATASDGENNTTQNITININNIAEKVTYTILVPKNKFLAGYEIGLQFKDTLPSNAELTLDNSLLGKNGRTVTDLGPSVDDTDKTIVFGAFSYGTEDDINGNLQVLTIKTLENPSNITFTKQVFLDKDANALTLNSELK